MYYLVSKFTVFYIFISDLIYILQIFYQYFTNILPDEKNNKARVPIVQGIGFWL